MIVIIIIGEVTKYTHLNWIELKVYLFLKTVEQSKQFEHEQLWISRKGATKENTAMLQLRIEICQVYQPVPCFLWTLAWYSPCSSFPSCMYYISRLFTSQEMQTTPTPAPIKPGPVLWLAWASWCHTYLPWIPATSQEWLTCWSHPPSASLRLPSPTLSELVCS